MTATTKAEAVPGHVYLLKPTTATTRSEAFKAFLDQLFQLAGSEDLREEMASYVTQNSGDLVKGLPAKDY